MQINGLALEDQADFYRFETLDYATSHDSVSLTFDDDLGDLNLYVYQSDGTTLVGSSTGYGDSESVSLAGQAPGVFYAKVTGRSGDANSTYSLKIDPPGNTTDDPYEPNDTVEQVLEHTAGGSESPNLGRLVVSTSLTRLALYDQADFYGFELTDYGRSSDFARLEFSHAAGNLDLYLHSEGDTNALASATGWSDNETISLNNYPPGKYYLGVVGRNGAGNFNYQLTIAPPPAPPVRADLQVLSASGLVPRSWVAPGTTVFTDWQVRNMGEVAANGFDLTWYLSADSVLDAADTPLATRKLSLAPGASEANTNDFVTVPIGTTVGEYFLILAADPAGVVVEHCETNNWLAAPLTVSSAAAPQTVLRGAVVADQNANRFGDAGEAGLAGVTVLVDANRNGRRDAGEPTTTTDAQGKYEFAQIPPGWWSVQLEVSDRQQSTYPVVPAEPGVYVVDDDGVLGVVDPISGAVRVVGETGQAFYDIAFDPWGRLYGITSSSLYRIDPRTAAVERVGGHAASGANALTFDADGVLYAANALFFGGSRLYRIDPRTAATTEVANLGTVRSAGDLAFHQGKLYLTTDSDQLVEIVLGATAAARVVGPLGRSDVMGLVTGDDGVLYGLTHNVVLRINPATGVAETVSSFRGRGLGQSYGGAVWSEAFQPRQSHRLTRTVADQPTSGVDFGVVTTSRLDGTLYHDDDRSATRTANEPPLTGWYVFVDTNRDGAWQASESRTQSTATGEFSFAGLTPGVHRLQVLPADGWALTTSAHSYMDVTVSSSVPSVTVEIGADRADPPRIVALWPQPDSEVQATVAAIDMDFNQPMELATLWPGSFELLASGGDGGFYEGQERRITIERVDWDPALNRATLELSEPLSRDHYRLRVRDQMIDALGTRLDGEWRGRFPTGDSLPGGDSLFRFFVVNSPPTVVNQRGTGLQGVAQPIQLEANDPEGDALTFSLLAGPAHGQLTQTDPDGQWRYTADSNYSGTDQFGFRVTDIHGASSDALYELRITRSPVDLEPLALTVGTTGLTPGLPFRVAWTVINRGPGATADYYGEDWADEVYVSSDATLDASDRRLLRWPTEAGVVLSGQQITVAPEAELVLDQSLALDGTVYLLVRVNANRYQREANEGNNVLAQQIPLRPGVQLTSPTAGQFVATGGTLDLQWRDFNPERSATLALVIDIDGDPSNGQGETVLATGIAEDDPLNRSTVRVPSLNPGTYYVFARMEDGQGVYYSTPVAVRVVDEVFASDEPLGDALGGSGYEVFDILAGRIGDEVQFRVRTNFDPRQRGGDLYLNVGGSYDRNTGQLAGIAANTRTTLSGATVTAGALYVGATFQQGTARSAHPTFISDFQAEIVGRSAFRVESSSNTAWRYEITGSFYLSDLGASPGDALQIGWAMYCGNDFAHAENGVTLPDLAGDGFAIPRDSANQVSWGDAITVSYATINQGTEDAAATQARVVLSRDTQFTGDDVLLATLAIPALDVNQRVEWTTAVSLPSVPPAGFSTQDRVYVGVIQDFGDAVREGDEVNNAGLGDGIDWAPLSVGGPPRFVNILTHGFNPTFWDFDGFRSNWLGPFNSAVEDLARDQGFASNSVNYVTQWDSSSGWIDAMLSTVAYFVLRLDPRTQWLAPLALARVGPAMDRAERLAYAAGSTIVDDLLTLPDYLAEPVDGQEIHLIGHSRGGAVSAYASALLADRGYTVAQATMLDGYSTDWPNLSGILGDISIVDLTTADRKVNYRVEAGLAESLGASLADTIHQYLPWLPRPDLLQSLGRLPDWRAPARAAAGFEDELLRAYSPYARSDHLNISDLYFFSDRNMPPDTAYIRNSPLGLAAAGASGAAPAPAFAEAEPAASPLLESAVQLFANFNDGSLDKLGDIWRQTESLAADLTLDDPFLDAWLQIARQSESLLESVWTTQGDVRLGVDAGDAWLELAQLDQDAAVGQYLVIGDSADALQFALSVSSAGPDDRLVVTLDDEPIYSVLLSDAGAAGLKEVPLESLRGRSGQVTFTLTGPLSSPASMQLDDLRVVANLSLGSLVANPVEPTAADPNVQLIATGLYDPQGIAVGVAFYVESNGLPGLQSGAGADRRLGLDVDGTDGWKFSWNTASETGDVLTVYAQAESNQPIVGGVIAARVLPAENTTPWRNGPLPTDADANGRVEPQDVLLIINYINGHSGSSSLPDAPATPPPYYDVNGDNTVTAADVLTVINYINSRNSGTALAEGESSDAEGRGTKTDEISENTVLDLGLLGIELESLQITTPSLEDGRSERPTVQGPCVVRKTKSHNSSSGPFAWRHRFTRPNPTLRSVTWTPTNPAGIKTKLSWAETEEVLSVIAADVAALGHRR